MIVGINASRARSGGARAHLIGVLSSADPAAHGIREVHVWSYRELLGALPVRAWLHRHAPSELERGLPSQVWWEWAKSAAAMRAVDAGVILNIDAGTVSRARPAVTMSRDMLSYEPGEIERYGLTPWRLRLIAIRGLQNRALRRAEGAVFLTRYAGEVIQRHCGKLREVQYIPHGVGEEFRASAPSRRWPAAGERPIELLYISPVWRFKHQWNVVAAVAELRRRGHAINLTLAGAGEADMIARLRAELARSDPRGEWVRYLGHVPHGELPALTARADLYVFASSCENMPNTLLEGMAAGLPVASSDRGPMPEVLAGSAALFDPEAPHSIAAAIERLILDPAERTKLAAKAWDRALEYSWKRCADETFAYLARIAKRHRRAA
jgi:glycosyltransferase involved in cell wall biosynthesis